MKHLKNPLALATMAFLPFAVCRAENLYPLDLSKPEPRTDELLPNQGGKAKEGTTYTATRNGFFINGKPWYPVSGEFHYVRMEPAFWDRELAKLRACGVDIVATYVFWNHHENPEGKWDWTGRRDLRKFLELAQRRGLKVWLRFGPYINAETTNGGIPGFADKGKRSNDPDYLRKVEAYFKELYAHTKGMFAIDGGPIVGVQLDNEFAGGDAKHITKLREMAVAAGMVAPFYTVTANSRFEKDTAIPLQGGYVYRGWEGGGGGGAVSGFIFGTDEWTANTDLGGTYYQTLDYPRGYCEMGTGSPMRGGNRFIVDPKHTIGTAYDAVGRGSNYLGYYMFHGGTQVPGLNHGWPITYDFQAPLGEFGMMRESYALYRRLHTFVGTYAKELLDTRIVRDPEQIMDPKQTKRLRYIGRFDKEGRGFVFIGNIQRNVAMPVFHDARIELSSPSGKTLFPDKAFTVPGDTYNFFPVKTDLGGGAELVSATVEPVAKITNPDEPNVFVYWRPAWTDGALTLGSGCTVKDASGKAVLNGDIRTAHAPADQRSIYQVSVGGKTVARIVVLTDDESRRAFVAKVAGKSRLILTGPDTQISSIHPFVEFLATAGKPAFAEIFQSSGETVAPGWTRAEGSGFFTTYRRAASPAFAAPKLEPAGKPGEWKISFSNNDWKNLAEARLDLSYLGGEGTLLVDGKEYSGDLYHGEPWHLDLLFFRDNLDKLTIRISPWGNGISGVSKPEGDMPSIENAEWRPLVRVLFTAK